MYPKYSMLYNELSESQNPYVVLSEDSKIFQTILPISYFWLKKNNRLGNLNGLSQNLSKIQFREVSNKRNFLERASFYEEIFGEIYEGFPITENNLPSLNDLSIFLEHYMHNRHLPELDRIEKSITKYDFENNIYIESLGPLISFLTKKKQEEIHDQRLKILFFKKSSLFEKFLN